MGNKSAGNKITANSAIIEKQFKWSKSNTRVHKIEFGTESKRNDELLEGCIDCERIPIPNGNNLLICCAMKDEVAMVQMRLLKKKKGKIEAQLQCVESVEKVMYRSPFCVAIGGECEYVAIGGADCCIRVFKIQESLQLRYDGTLYRELEEQHSGAVTCVKLINNRFVLSGSEDGTVVLWNFQTQTPLEAMATTNANSQGITSLDYCAIGSGVKLDFVVFGSKDGRVYIRDITKHINTRNDIDTIANDDEDWCKDATKMVSSWPQELGHFTDGVCGVAFSTNGALLAAISHDLSFEVYGKMEKYDSFWKSDTIEWTFLFKEKLPNHMIPRCIHWIDDKTLVIGTGAQNTTVLYMCCVEKRKEDSLVVAALNESVDSILRSISLSAVGLSHTLTAQIVLYLCECDVWEYQYRIDSPLANDNINCNVTSIASCALDRDLIAFCCDDGVSYAITSNIDIP